MIPAIVLTAGMATRLRPLSLVRAKAALPVAGQSLVERIINQFAAAGVRDLVLNLHHLPHTITGLIGDGAHLGVRVRYSWENPILGSAGGPRRALPLLDSRRFLIVNGDTLNTVDAAKLIAAHEQSGALVTMAVVPNSEPDKYGGLLVDDDGAVRGFTRRGSKEASYHFVGPQVAESKAFARLPDNVPYESVTGLYPELIRERRGSVHAYISDAEFHDIGTVRDYVETSLRFAAREGRTLHDENILWDHVTIEPGAKLRRCVLTDGVSVPAHAAWEGQTVRVATGSLDAAERREDGLALAPIAA